MTGRVLRKNPKKKVLGNEFDTDYNSDSTDDEHLSSNNGGARDGGVTRGANINQSNNGGNFANQLNGGKDSASDITNSQTNDVTLHTIRDGNVLDSDSGSGTTRVEGEAGAAAAPLGLNERAPTDRERNNEETQTNNLTDNNADLNRTTHNSNVMTIQDALAIWELKFEEVDNRLIDLKDALSLTYSVLTQSQIEEIERLNGQKVRRNRNIKLFMDDAKSAALIRNGKRNGYRDAVVGSESKTQTIQTNHYEVPANHLGPREAPNTGRHQAPATGNRQGGWVRGQQQQQQQQQ